MIGASLTIAPEKYRAMLNVTVENQGVALQLSHLEAAMRKIWWQSGGCNEEDLVAKWRDDGISTAKRGSEIVLTAFEGIC